MMPSDTGLWIIKPEGTREKKNNPGTECQNHKTNLCRITTVMEQKIGKYKNKPPYYHYCDGTRRKGELRATMCNHKL